MYRKLKKFYYFCPLVLGCLVFVHLSVPGNPNPHSGFMFLFFFYFNILLLDGRDTDPWDRQDHYTLPEFSVLDNQLVLIYTLLG